jgi:hypothetical protein
MKKAAYQSFLLLKYGGICLDGMPKGKGEPIFRKLQSVRELARLACAFERVPRPTFGILVDGKYALSVHSEQLGESPVFFYAMDDRIDQFLKYKLEDEMEEVTQSSEATDPRYLYSPILAIKSVPETYMKSLMKSGTGLSKASSMELSDVVSLLKLSSYRVLIDEAPAPLYLGKDKEGYKLGAYVHIGDSDGSDILFFVKIDSDPQKNFVRYDPQRPSAWSYTNRTGEHGSYYAKIIRLADSTDGVEEAEE